MTERVLPGIGLTGFWDQGAPWKVGGDQNWLLSSVLTQLGVVSATTSLPASPLNGVIYIVPVGDPNANQIAARDNGAWAYFAPQEGWTAYVRDTGVLMNFDGTDWVPSTKPLSEALALPGGSGGIGFLQAGMGAVPRPVETELRDTLSATQFGVLPDGVTDVTANIQAALDALQVNGQLEFPQGVYLLSDELNCSTSNISIVGRGAKFVQTGANKKTLVFSGSGIEVSGIWFQGKGTEHIGAGTSFNGVAGVYLDNCTDVNVHHCTFTNHAGGSIRWGTAANGFRFTDNVIVGIGAAGGIVSGDNNSDFAVAGFGSAGDNRVIVSKNDISAHCFGIGLSRGNGCVIAGNVVHDIPGQHGMYLSQQSTTSITGNSLRDIALEGIKNQIATEGATATDILIANNNIQDVGNSGVVVGRTGALTTGGFDRVTIVDNIIDTAGNYGIVLESVDNFKLRGNTIDTPAGYGIYCNEGFGGISGNTIRDANWNAMALELTGDTDITDNVIIDAVLNLEAGSSQARYLYYVNVSKGATAITDPKVFISGNRLSLEGAAPTHFAASGKCVRANTGVLVYWGKNWNLTTKAWQFNTAGELKYMDIGFSPSVDFTASQNLNPTTPIYGRGRRELYGTQSPAAAAMTDTFRTGDICWNSAQATSTSSGWICVAAGTPGTWARFAGPTRRSSTANRPTLTAEDVGVLYLDTTLTAAGKPVWWNGTTWVDATGVAA